MRLKFGSEAKRGMGSERGGVAVEFAIILPLLLFLVLGGMDLGHMFYLDYLSVNASREGARYAAKYTGGSSQPTSAQISTYVSSTLNYNAILPNLKVSGTTSNSIVTVTVKADKTWWILNSVTLFNMFGWQGFTNPTTLTATTAMKLEL